MEALKKKYRTIKIATVACYIAAYLSASVPEIIAAIIAAPSVKEKASMWNIAGFASALVLLMVIIVGGGAIRKFSQKLPFTLNAFVIFAIILVLFWAMQDIISDAIVITLAGTIGAAVGVVFEVAASCCAGIAKDVKQEYLMVKARMTGISPEEKDDTVK